MARYFGEYGSRNQQDAHEFLGDVINTLQEELCPLARTLAASHLLQTADKADDHHLLKTSSEARTSTATGGLSQGGVNTPLPPAQPQGSLSEVHSQLTMTISRLSKT
jgi:hypothetical protein